VSVEIGISSDVKYNGIIRDAKYNGKNLTTFMIFFFYQYKLE